jgi:two-component system, LytTR family, response regulator LytT
METQTRNTEFSITNNSNGFEAIYEQQRQFSLDDLVAKLAVTTGKKSFLVFKQNKYFTVPVESIAFFQVKYESSTIVCTDRREYPVNYSLDQIQHLLTGNQFFRVNRQYLVNFTAIKEVEYYFARKLLVNLLISTAEKLIVPKEKVRNFLYWMENR